MRTRWSYYLEIHQWVLHCGGMKVSLLLVLLCTVCATSDAQSSVARWCTVGEMEQRKCLHMKETFATMERTRSDPVGVTVECVQVEVANACLRKIAQNKADLVRLTDPAAYAAGRFHNLVPILRENTGERNYLYQTVAVIRADNKDINSLENLRGKKSCHTGVGRTAGWQSPIANLNAEKLLPITDCENNVRNAADFFSSSCVPGAMDSVYDPDSNNPQRVCDLCENQTCSSNQKYSGYLGAFRCLVDGKGDVAFVKHSTVPIDARNAFTYDTLDYRLLCLDGSRDTVDNYARCSWGVRPSRAIFTRPNAEIEKYKRLFERGSTEFGRNTNNSFQMFSSNSKNYNGKDLLFADGTFDLVNTGSMNTYVKYLGQGFVNFYEYVRPKACRKNVRMCVISAAEMDKCSDMRDAIATGKITVDFSCVLGTDRNDCMEKISSGDADITTASDWEAYQGEKYYGLSPFFIESYPNVDAEMIYWAVAVAKKNTAVSLNNLKGKKICSSGIWTSDGWNLPMGTLVKDGKVTISACQVERDLATYLGNSCVPGATNNKLCSLCQANCGKTGKYAGGTGAISCLEEKGADVAFVSHATLSKMNNATLQTLKLLCPGGSDGDVKNWKGCNLGKVPARAVLTDWSRGSEYIRHYKFIFTRTQYRYGKGKMDKTFKMFASPKGQADLIFSDDASKLTEVTYTDNAAWFGKDYMNKVKAVDPRMCVSAGSTVSLFGAVHILCCVLMWAFIG